MADSQRIYAFALLPGFSMLALGAACDALRAANIALGRQAYGWALVGEEARVPASNGVPLATRTPAEAPACHAVAAVGGEASHDQAPPALSAWLRRQAAAGAELGALSDAPFWLARLGLLAGRRCTIHWKCLDSLRERHPELDVRASLVELDGPRFTCAGATATLDLFLQLIGRDHGPAAVGAVAANFLVSEVRSDPGANSLGGAYADARRSPLVAAAVAAMEADTAEPPSVAQLAARVGVGKTRLDRAFRRETGMGPARFQRRLRLRRAGQLLKLTALPVSEVAAATGFASTAHLSRHLKAETGETPQGYRRRGAPAALAVEA